MPLLLLLALLCAPAFATAQEVATQEEAFTFKTKVNLVLVPVVVRDKKGNAIDNLKQEDFQLFDRGKVQTIVKFSIEHPGSRAIPLVTVPGDAEQTTERTLDVPNHFVAYLFDDVHLQFGDLAQLREAARKHLEATAHPGARFAVYTTSGRNQQDFTADLTQIQLTLLKLRPNPIARSGVQGCPDISLYMADLIINKNDSIALNAAASETMICQNLPDAQAAQSIARAAAQMALSTGEHESTIALYSIGDAVRRLSAMPGERTLLLASPGFIRLNDQFSDESTVMDRATHANVIINTLDARGLYTDMPDITKRGVSFEVDRVKRSYDIGSARASADVLAELAAGTGGTFIENTNDLKAGFDRLSGAPSVYYILGFSPQNLKLDGAFHPLKVSVREPSGLDVKARKGYYAPKHLSSADEDAKEEISQAVFSREEMHEIPIDIRTQFFKASETDARLQVSAKLDVRKLHFRKVGDRNGDDVVVVAALFDRNGNYLQGSSKLLNMKLKDETLQSKLDNGLTVRTDFKVTPGTYVIRLVVRDAEGQMMASRNGAVEIP